MTTSIDCNTTQEMLKLASERLDFYIYLTLGSILVSVIALIVAIYYNRKQLEKSDQRHKEALIESQKHFENNLEASKKQLEKNHDWNRRSFTASSIATFSDELMKIRDELDLLTIPSIPTEVSEDISKRLDSSGALGIIMSNNGKYISFTDRINQSERLTPDEVHNWVCQRDGDGNHIPSKSGKNPPCKTSLNGEQIVNNIIKFINIYEQIGINLKNGIYDEETLKDAFKHPIKANYLFYKDYIEHRVNDHKDENFGATFKWLYEYFWNEKPEEKRPTSDRS
jgi:hypothetical protein